MDSNDTSICSEADIITHYKFLIRPHQCFTTSAAEQSTTEIVSRSLFVKKLEENHLKNMTLRKLLVLKVNSEEFSLVKYLVQCL